jgi:hypothetical protein
MNNNAIAVACLVGGALLIFWGRNMANSIGGVLENTFTGSPGDKPMMLYIAGGILCAAGIFQLAWKRK